MKKLLSLFIVILILSMTLLTASAASIMNGATVIVADAPAGIIADVVEFENTVEVTIKLKGEMNVAGASVVMQYQPTKVSIANATTKVSYTGAKLSTSVAVSPYVENVANLSGWSLSTYVVDPAHATYKHFGLGYGNVSGTNISLASGDEMSLFKVYFNKLADVVASDFNFVKVVTLQSKFNNGSISVYQGTGTDNATSFYRGDRFTSVFTNYVPTVTSKTVTYATTGSTSGTAPTQADTAPAATFAVAGAGSLVKTGYTLTGWNDGTNNYAIGATYTMPSANVTFTPVWTLITVTDLPIVAGDVVKGEGNHGYKNALGQTVSGNVKAVALPGKVPATIVDEASVSGNSFGIEFGGVFFPSKATFAGLEANGGKFIIKLVDPTGKLTGKTFKVYNVFNGAKSASINVVGE